MTEGHTPGLIERLRTHFDDCPARIGDTSATRPLLTEAADEITALRDRVAALEGALEPFVREADDAGAWHLPDDMLWQVASGEENTTGMLLTVGDFRNARSILSRAQQGGGE